MEMRNNHNMLKVLTVAPGVFDVGASEHCDTETHLSSAGLTVSPSIRINQQPASVR